MKKIKPYVSSVSDSYHEKFFMIFQLELKIKKSHHQIQKKPKKDPIRYRTLKNWNKKDIILP